MTDDRNEIRRNEESAESTGAEHVEQFNELSELSLEERMQVADRIGIPAENLTEAVALGTVSTDDGDVDSETLSQEEMTDEENNP